MILFGTGRGSYRERVPRLIYPPADVAVERYASLDRRWSYPTYTNGWSTCCACHRLFYAAMTEQPLTCSRSCAVSVSRTILEDGVRRPPPKGEVAELNELLLQPKE